MSPACRTVASSAGRLSCRCAPCQPHRRRSHPWRLEARRPTGRQARTTPRAPASQAPERRTLTSERLGCPRCWRLRRSVSRCSRSGTRTVSTVAESKCDCIIGASARRLSTPSPRRTPTTPNTRRAQHTAPLSRRAPASASRPVPTRYRVGTLIRIGALDRGGGTTRVLAATRPVGATGRRPADAHGEGVHDNPSEKVQRGGDDLGSRRRADTRKGASFPMSALLSSEATSPTSAWPTSPVPARVSTEARIDVPAGPPPLARRAEARSARRWSRRGDPRLRS